MLIALSIFAMLLLLAMATNVGVVVNDKIRMQTTADAATYAAAYSEAASLNELVDLNKGIVDAVNQCRQVMQTGLVAGMWPETVPCGCQPNSIAAETAISVCKVNIDVAIGRFVARAPYNRTVGTALDAGEATANANFANSRVSFFSDIFGSPTFPGTYMLQGGFNIGPPVIFPSIADFRQVSDTAMNYMVLATCGSPPTCVPTPMLGRTTYMKTWFYKESRDPDVWVAGRVSGTPEKQFLDTAYRSGGSDGGFFGASSTGGDDEIYAYAVAKPYDGSVGPSELNGIQQNSNMVGPLGVYISRGTTYPKLSMYDEYRARLAGANENLEGTLTPDELIRLDGYRNGKMWDMDKFKH
ncbi:MAG: pilus assembly protein TadG-related protein [Pseudomonadota bacterium]|nr:pilus assembly protein TadG-related protein [Pseudomonadota bacterium]